MNRLFSLRMGSLSGRGSRTILTVALLTIMLAFGAFSFAPAAHAASLSTNQTTQCQIVLAPLQLGEQTSHVLSSQCVQGNQQLAAPQASTRLMTWYINANYVVTSQHPNYYINIYGTSGPCDTTGYGFTYVGDYGSMWNDSISSFKVWNSCTYTRAYVNAGFAPVSTCKTYSGNVAYVGSAINDKISSFRIASAYHGC